MPKNLTQQQTYECLECGYTEKINVPPLVLTTFVKCKNKNCSRSGRLGGGMALKRKANFLRR